MTESKKQPAKGEETKKKEQKVPKKKFQEYKKQLNELTEHLQRLQAEFENYKKRIEAEKKEFIKYTNTELILKLLPIVDSFELALKNIEKHADFVKGVELIYSQFYEVLEREGIRRIDALNKKFDANKHEVMIVVESDAEPDTVIEELQPGYMLNDKVIRHTKVKISKKKVLRN